MTISGHHLGKKYGKNWVFRDLDIHISPKKAVAIIGSNGSGKSTLLKILSGYLTPSEGILHHNGELIDIDHLNSISYTAPYVEIPEEMDFNEFLDFHSKFRQKMHSNETISKKSNLPLNKRIMDFSTGMRQRVQLSTAFYFENVAFFMDEPTSNLDSEGFEWWKSEIALKENFPVILASNQKAEIEFCKSTISLKK